MKRWLWLAALLAACGDSGPTGPEAVVRIEVTPDSSLVVPGSVVQFEATSFTASGPADRPVTWSTTDPAIAVVDASGRVEARGLGTVTIRATAGAVYGAAELTVATWDLMFFSLGGGVFAETLVLPPFSGGFPERLFPVGRFAMDAVPAPDGARIAYAVRDVEGYTDLWVANRDGSNARLLVGGDGNEEWPSWSPDGSRIAFHSDRSGGLGDIYVVNVDGTGLQRLTTDPVPAVTSEIQPSWSPDGERIAFASNVGGTYDIYTIRPDGTALTRVTATTASELEPDWSPDGSRLALRLVDPENEWDLQIITADGLEVRRITLPGWQRAPSWRPDGAVLTFSGRVALGQPWQVWTIGADGASAAQQTPDSFTGGHRPVWLRRR